MIRVAAFFAAVASLSAADRIVSAGGSVTESVCALGAADKIVGVDSSSTHPPEITQKPGIGYARALSIEGILALNPDLVLATPEAGPPAVLRQLEEANVKVVILPEGHSTEAAEARIRAVAKAIGREPEADRLWAKITSDLASALPPGTDRPKVLFLYARAGGVMNVAGTDTAADAMIRLAGGINAVTGYAGYKPLTAEAAVAAMPDIILMTARGVESAGGREGVLTQPGLNLTPAGKANRVIAMDDLLLLGFGPRLGEAVSELSRQFAAIRHGASRD
jgi:iron complex transport system substrate-binding protein